MVNEYVCFDIETTGLNPAKQHIIEIGAVKIKDNKIVDQFSELINPGQEIPYKITQITNITTEMVKDANTIHEILPKFLEFCDNMVIMGHNLKFDYSFVKQKSVQLGKLFEKDGIDTLYIAKKALRQLESRSLGALCNYFNVTNLHAHRAYDDALATHMIYQRMKNEYEEIYPEAFEAKKMEYKVKKEEKATTRQLEYLKKLIRYHKIQLPSNMEEYSKSYTSYIIDKIILHYGKIGS